VLQGILQRYAFVMKSQGITAGEFKAWRQTFMLMTLEQMGQLLRVSPKTIENWESGRASIPFSMWWVMHVTMQDPEYFLTRPGFHDFYIEYDQGEAYLCSRRYPDIRFTTTDLYVCCSALQSVERLREAVTKKDAEIAELQAENTRLRQMLNAGAVTAELQAMHDHIGDLMRRIHTADIVYIPEKESAEVLPLRQAQA